MTSFAYIDFETSQSSDFYLVGIQIEEEFRQDVLTEKLSGFAEYHQFKVQTPEEFSEKFCKNCISDHLTIAAYSSAEKETLEKLTCCAGLKYLNLRAAAKAWIRKYEWRNFEALPELGVAMNLLPYQRRQLRNSLYSVSRLIPESQLDGLKIPHFRNYGRARVSTCFKTVIEGLEKRDQDYSKIAHHQKKNGTKALSHNRFDVQILPKLHGAIERADQGIIKSSIVRMS